MHEASTKTAKVSVCGPTDMGADLPIPVCHAQIAPNRIAADVAVPSIGVLVKAVSEVGYHSGDVVSVATMESTCPDTIGHLGLVSPSAVSAYYMVAHDPRCDKSGDGRKTRDRCRRRSRSGPLSRNC